MIRNYENLNRFLTNESPYYTSSKRTFGDIFPSAEDFEAEYKASGCYDPDNAITKIKLLYYLLCAERAYDTPASYSEDVFKYGVFSTIFMYGPAWETKLKAQHKIRELLENEDELLLGSEQIHNHSYNPSSPPATNAYEALKTIDDQTAQRWKKSKLEGYAQLLAVLRNDVSKEFLDKFDKLFDKVPMICAPRFETTPEEQEILKS